MTCRKYSILTLKALLSLAATMCAPFVQAEDRGSIQLELPGSPIYLEPQEKPVEWYALSLKSDMLSVQRVSGTRPSDHMHVFGDAADRLLAGQPLDGKAEAQGYTMNAPADTLLLLRIEHGNEIPTGQYRSNLPSEVLREGWRQTAEIAGRKWNFFVRHQKRPDGKLLAGSLEIMATQESAKEPTILLPPANGLAFKKQELLWLGDFNTDGQPDMLLRRAWITGEVDFVVVIPPTFASVYMHPDKPAKYFSSGVEPSSNYYLWHKSSPTPAPVDFVAQDSLSIDFEAWHKLLPDPYAPAPKVLADQTFKPNGETLRIALEHLPRVQGEQGSTPLDSTIWMGTVLVKATFRGKVHVLAQVVPPDEGSFDFVGRANRRQAGRTHQSPAALQQSPPALLDFRRSGRALPSSS